jgi:hypothetical protein
VTYPLKAKLPTAEPWGIPPRRWLWFTIEPYTQARYTPALEPSREAPGLSIKCCVCGAQLEKLENGDLVCYGPHKVIRVQASRFCLEAVARAAYAAWGIPYSYEAYLRRTRSEVVNREKAIQVLNRLTEAAEQVKVPEYTVKLVAAPGGYLFYQVEDTAETSANTAERQK